MTVATIFHDPLSIDLRSQTGRLLSEIPQNTSHHEALRNASTTRQLLATLSNLLSLPQFTQIVATLFRPILLDLCVRWIDNADSIEDALIALCYLLEVHEELFPILNQILLKYYKNGPLYFINGVSSPISFDTTRLQRLLLAYYRILQANRELPTYLLWSPEPLSTLVWTPHLDNAIRLLAIRCYSLQAGMGEAERLKMELEVLGEPCAVDCRLNYGQNLAGEDQEVDGWIMPVVELKRVQQERNKIVTQEMQYFLSKGEDTVLLRESDLCPRTANIHGILLVRSSPVASIQSSLIPLPSSIEALRQLSLNLSSCIPTLLTSAPSAGKALLLSHLASVLHPETENQIVTIHLADTSLDPRGLLGAYVSSTVRPGTFDWKEGVLVRAMREGRWIVFEDIDRGSNEVLGVIKPLVESMCIGKWIGGRGHISVPGRGTITAYSNFMLFATRSVSRGRDGTFHPPTFFGAHKFSEVVVQSPSLQELHTIVSTKYPSLSGRAGEAAVNLWESVLKLSLQRSERDIGIRELLKFCQRLDKLLPSHQSMDIDSSDAQPASFAELFSNPSLREDMYLEARDVFFGAGTMTASSRAHSKAVSQVVGDALGLDEDRQQWILEGKLPEMDLEKDVNGRNTALRLGRTRLSARLTKGEIQGISSRPFAMHKPAVKLLSRIANAISHGEPVLLTGETGTGKTSVVSHLATLLNRPLISLNLSHQTESSDLIGGLKPIDTRIPGSALQEKFLALFGVTFSRRKNEKFEAEVRKAVNECKWKRAVGLWKESVRLAMERIQARNVEDERNFRSAVLDDATPRKRRRMNRPELKTSEHEWATFMSEVEDFDVQHVHGKGKFAFGFVEGPLIKALRTGSWILLDEINLASPETLESLSGLLDSPTASITLTEHGSLEPIPRHPDFRLFACMNPATDVGKKDLPPPIRTRFTEIDVPPPDADRETLLSIITQYIGHIAVGDKRIIMDVAEFYSAVKQVAESRQIADGANHRPHFSMRTLVRALTFAADTASGYSLRRSIWEGCLMAFTMVLDSLSAEVVTGLARKHLLSGVRNPRALLSKDPAPPLQGAYIKLGPFYLEKGPLDDIAIENYIMTPSVEQKLVDLARIILTRRFPVLIEGPTSSGKTSSIEYLAKRTGHRFIRINNHDHTDIQEYLGSYVSDPLTGKLVFKDGLLVQALRFGHWIVLDELNLAPTDVLEALNRLLDDNRELVIPETQEVIRPHPHFMLFATQNPPGLYAGRKVLSRAFRNRFLEVHFEDVPQSELETILCQRCQIAPSYGKKIVTVFHELQKRRQSGRVFESKQGFATLRDLFRWAGRDAVGYQALAENGYMLLAERARRREDKEVVKEVIETVMNVKIDEETMYNIFRSDFDARSFLGRPLPSTSDTVWTKAMQRLYTLVCRGLKFNEPILLVGETGSGKTSVCQVFAEASSQRLLALNCHQNTETADLIGGLRPVRNRSTLQTEIIKEALLILNAAGVNAINCNTIDALDNIISSTLQGSSLDADTRNSLEEMRSRVLRLHSIFEWHDGPLIEAMCNGDVFLLDEISLADDSVLERLNSVLEPSRSIVLAERGGTDSSQPAIHASDDFKLIATMNPGGDYGKKELSPALRNRFTEIWVPAVDNRQDLTLIVDSLWLTETLRRYTSPLLDFIEWLCVRVGDKSLLSLRDILAWVVFINSAYKSEGLDGISELELFHHAAHMTYLDGLSSFPQLAGYSREAFNCLRTEAITKLQELVPLPEPMGVKVPDHDPTQFVRVGSFTIPRGSEASLPQIFNFTAPTTLDNAMRIIRACQVPKPILLEGSPGVGKTSLITALANLSGHHLCRINLSDQTDLIDLFGSDLPVEGGNAGEFAWKDAEFLKALQDGHWVLLDEMNLAPQAVLEGLNAILDHRGTVYIPELNRSFKKHPAFRIFAAQNPLHQGGGRKGLPKSFVNRFTKVYVEELTPDDLHTVCSHIFPDIDESVLRSMITFNIELADRIILQRAFAQDGSPWEFNLRDVVRWGTLMTSSKSSRNPLDYIQTVYLQRFRNPQDRRLARTLFDEVFCTSSKALDIPPTWNLSPYEAQFGSFTSARLNFGPLLRPCRVLKSQLSALESLGHCVSQSCLAILTGPRNSGKSDIVRTLANIVGTPLWEVSVNNSTDTMDILGSFEQVDTRKRFLGLLDEIVDLLDAELRTCTGSKIFSPYWVQARALKCVCEKAMHNEVSRLAEQILVLLSSLVLSGSTSKSRYEEIEVAMKSILTSATVQFEWVDGPLVKALKSGQWILLDGANLCGPSVLDRLNSLCEAGGSLTLSERGFVDGNVQIIKPHPNFRLFMSVDPHYGELSRAMRNRGVEIALLPKPLGDDVQILHDHQRLPLVTSLAYESPAARWISFGLARRGLNGSQVTENYSHPSSGRYFDQDSALSNLIDGVPEALLSSPNIENTSWIPVLSRTLTLAYLPYLTRYLARYSRTNNILSNFLNNFPPNNLNAALMVSRNAYILQKKIGMESILHKMTYFFWNEGLTPQNTHATDATISRSFLLEILNLGSALSLFEQIGSHDLVQDKYSLNQKDQQAREAVACLLHEVVHVASDVLEQSSEISESNLSAIKLASTLLDYSVYLSKALNSVLSDFSALNAISNWFITALENCSALFEPSLSRAKVLHDVISLSTGLGLFALWSTLYTDNMPQNIRDMMNQTNLLSSSLNESADVSRIRLQSFNVLSMESLPSLLQSFKSTDLLDIRTSLNQCLSINTSNADIEPLVAIDPRSSILELGILASWSKKCDIQLMSNLMREIISLTCCSKNASLLRIIPYQHLLWSSEVGMAPASLVTKAQIQWLDGLWKLQTGKSNVAGPGVLFRPISMYNAVSICDMNQVDVRTLSQHDNVLRQQAHLTIVHSEQTMDRMQQFLSLLFQGVAIIASAFSSSFDPTVYRDIQEAASGNIEELPQSFANMTSLLLQCKDHVIVAAVEQEMTPLLLIMAGRTPQQIIGIAWVGLSCLLSNLVIPDTPIDPVVVHNCIRDRTRRMQDDISTQISLHQQIERLLTGNEDNDFVQYLTPPLEQTRKELAKLPTLPSRNNVSRLHLFWSEVLQFQTSVLASSKLKRLVNALLEGDAQALLQEQVIQESLQGFYQRLDSVYPEFVDISTLLKLSILYMRLGLKTIVESTSSHLSKNASVDLATTLVSFPSISCSNRLITDLETVGPSGIGAFHRVLLTLGALSLERAINIRSENHTRSLHVAYEQAIGLWLIDRAKEKKELEDASTLYRTVNYNAATDVEIEEEEFLTMFPTFEDALESGPTPVHLQTSPPSRLVQPEDVSNLLRIHYNLTGLGCKTSTDDPDPIFTEMKSKVLQQLVSESLEYLPETLDEIGLPFQFSLLQDRIVSLDAKHTAISSYNFYSDANYTELKKAANVIDALRRRLVGISEEWPDQMVVQHLIERCDTILSMNSKTSIAQAISMLEQLLVQSEDWEMYSNRHNSIKMHQEDMIRLMVNWRRLELACWQTLLDSQAKTFTEDLGQWWFRLYDAIIRGSLSTIDDASDGDQNLTQYLSTLIPLLDDFITSSPLGQYAARMQLIQSFERYITMVSTSKSSDQRSALDRVSRVLNASYRYYHLFSDGIQKRLIEEKTVLEKEVKKFITLASWKDINIQALKQSAQRTHRQLYKIVRKFRDVLRQPVAAQMQPRLAGDLDSQAMTFDRISGVIANVYFPESAFGNAIDGTHTSQGHLLKLDKTFERFQTLVNKQLLPFIASQSAQTIDDAAVEIITTSKTLAAITLPLEESIERREKHRKALLVRKRKAWADMLKELKRAGLASNLKPEILSQNANQQWIREQPTLLAVEGAGIEIEKGDAYFVKLCGCLPSLRSSLPTHHSDLTTRELKRGHMFVESGFAMGMDLRSRLIFALSDYVQIRDIMERLSVLNASEIVQSSSNVIVHTSSIKNVLCKVLHALQELRENANAFNKLTSDPPILTSFFDELSAALNVTSGVVGQLDVLVKNMNAVPLSYVTQGEINLLSEAERLLARFPEKFLAWKKAHPHLNYLLSPLQAWLGKEQIIPLQSPAIQTTSDTSELDLLLNSLLVSIQSLASKCPGVPEEAEEDSPEKYLAKGYHFAREFTHNLNLHNIKIKLQKTLLHVSSRFDFTAILQKIIPFLTIFLDLAKDQLATHNNWMKAIFKLDFVLCSLLHSLSQQGFCQPQETGESDSNGEASEETGGVGIGEGSGKDNVSKDIEDEGQVEGLKDDSAEANEPEGQHEDGDAIEMDNDFGGTLEDVEEPGSDDEETKSEDGSEPEFDETIGDLDDLDPSAVDEKMWGDEKGPESNDRPEEKAGEDRSKDQDGPSEVSAKESKEQQQLKDQPKDDKKQTDEPESNFEEQEENKVDEGDNDQSNDPNVNGTKMDEYVDDANTLELPEEIDLGGDAEMEDGDEKEDETMDDVYNDMMEDEGGPVEDEEQVSTDDPEVNEPSRDAPAPPVPDENQPNDEADQNVEDSGEGNNPDEGNDEDETDAVPDEIVARPDLSKDGGMTDPNDVAMPEAGEGSSTGEAGTLQGGAGDAATTEEKVPDDQGLSDADQPVGPEPADTNGKGSASSGIQQGQAPSQTEIQPVPNPLRSLGDALKEIRQRFDEILNSRDDNVENPQEKSGQSSTHAQVEYLRPEDEDHDMRAMGPAGEDQVAKLDQLTIIDDEETADDSHVPMDVDTPLVTENHDVLPRQPDAHQDDGTGTQRQEDSEGAILQTGLRANLEVESGSELVKNDAIIEEDQTVELQLKEWRAADYPQDGAEHMWRLYESLTHDLAYTLCEQLRLILEPTMATRLKGDYRTGKRLNMKKVISYIASDYTKDKIWLRRTKPSQREYQVLISIDDSRSMAESHSVHLAYQTLALISKALSRLESGDVAIAKFGETVDLLHGFDSGPFSDQAGTKVVNAFRFSQKATNVLSLLETSLKVLEHARERKAMTSASAADLWQLQIIISDGMCQDHEKLRTVLRRAEEQRVMIVFIILDSLQAGPTGSGTTEKSNSGSILHMDKAEFKNVDGKMELQLQKYLDSFPFEYYVVLRQVEALPEVLAGTLKQFFERVSEE